LTLFNEPKLKPVVVVPGAADLRIQILDLGGPVREEHPLGAAASGPARLHGAVLVQPAIALHFAIREAARAVDQQLRAQQGDADAAANRAEPIQARWLPEEAKEPGEAAAGAQSRCWCLESVSTPTTNIGVIWYQPI
jgi:hypothetical protein